MKDQIAMSEKQCGNCRFWSEMCAQSVGLDPMEALCLSSDGPRAGRYTQERHSCAAWQSGHFGAVDAPPNYGARSRALYEAEEGIT